MEDQPYSVPTNSLFHTEEEQELVAGMIDEGYHLIYPLIPVILIDRDAHKLDAMLLEDPDKVWKDPLYIPGHVEWSPPDFLLRTFGIETEQEVIVTFPETCLLAAGIEDIQEMVGGVIVMDLDKARERKEYTVRVIYKKPQDAWDQYGDVLNIAATVHPRDQSSTDPDTKLPWYDDTYPEGGLFGKESELETYNAMVVEGFRLIFPSIPLILINRAQTKVDLTLREAPIRKWLDPIYVPGHIEWQAALSLLHHFGIESSQETLITFPEIALHAAGIEDLQDMVGGIVALSLDASNPIQKEYEIIAVHHQPQGAWNLAGDILNVAVSVEQRTSSSVDEVDDVPRWDDLLGFV